MLIAMESDNGKHCDRSGQSCKVLKVSKEFRYSNYCEYEFLHFPRPRTGQIPFFVVLYCLPCKYCVMKCEGPGFWGPGISIPKRQVPQPPARPDRLVLRGNIEVGTSNKYSFESRGEMFRYHGSSLVYKCQPHQLQMGLRVVRATASRLERLRKRAYLSSSITLTSLCLP